MLRERAVSLRKFLRELTCYKFTKYKSSAADIHCAYVLCWRKFQEILLHLRNWIWKLKITWKVCKKMSVYNHKFIQDLYVQETEEE